jgi:hypothetical protein
MALRKLLGQDLFKVAGIIDALSGDPPLSVIRPRTPTNPLSNEATSKGRKSRPDISPKSFKKSSKEKVHKSAESAVSFSKANFLLPSTATEGEINTFVGGITASLIEKSDFYIPELPLKPSVIDKGTLALSPTKALPSSPARSNTQNDTSPSHPPPTALNRGNLRQDSKISRLTGGGSSMHKYASSIRSIASTVRTTDSGRRRREDARVEREWENTEWYIGEVDSDDDDYDRMVMGRAMARIVPEVVKDPKKRSTKKALQWLGLA